MPVPRLRAGVRLGRAWRGVTHVVTVLADGFEWNGERYRSLSAIAREITGTSWNGRAFFGITKAAPRRAAPEPAEPDGGDKPHRPRARRHVPVTAKSTEASSPKSQSETAAHG